MNLASQRALFSLTVEELLLGENVSESEFWSIYRPKADRGEDRQAAGLRCAVADAGQRAGGVAWAGKNALDDSHGAAEA